jgi:hypothetical protein
MNPYGAFIAKGNGTRSELHAVNADLTSLLTRLNYFNFSKLCDYLEEIYILEEVFYHVTSPCHKPPPSEVAKAKKLIEHVNNKLQKINKHPLILKEIKNNLKEKYSGVGGDELCLYSFKTIPKTLEEIVVIEALTPSCFEDKRYKLVCGEKWLMNGLTEEGLLVLPENFQVCESVTYAEVESIAVLYAPSESTSSYTDLKTTLSAVRRLLAT